jgi:hypothetical protein
MFHTKIIEGKAAGRGLEIGDSELAVLPTDNAEIGNGSFDIRRSRLWVDQITI